MGQSRQQDSETPAAAANGAPPRARAGARDGSWWLLLLCLLATYPLALVCPVRTGPELVFYFALPTFAWLTLEACARLALGAGGRPPGAATAPQAARIALLLTGAAAMAFCCWRDWATDGPGWGGLMQGIGLFVVPVAWALVPPAWAPARLAGLLAIVWAVQVAHGLWQSAVGFEVVGLAGNRNWMASLVLALAPWAALAAARVSGAGRWRGRIAQAAVWGISLALAWRGQSRGAWVAMASYVFLFVGLPRLRGARARLAALAAAVLCLGAIAVWLPAPARAALRQDVRPPLWLGTLRLVADHPLLGVGPGNFRREFVAYKTARQKQLPQAAVVTDHPHNELLHQAATLGVPLALVWALLWGLPLLLARRDTAEERALHVSAFLLCVHGGFDLVLVRPPTSVLAATAVGLLWARLLPAAAPAPQAPATAWRGAVAGLAVLAALALGVPLGLASWWQRDGWCREAGGDWAGAYRAYARAAAVVPRDPEPAFLAGSVAGNRLRDVPRALHHFRRVYALDPNYAHVNGEIGAAFGALRRPADARPFFEQELALFPYEPLAVRRLLLCELDLGNDRAAIALAERLGPLDRRRAERVLGPERVRALAAEFMRGLASGAPGPAALTAGQELSASRVHDWVRDPALNRLLAAGVLDVAAVDAPLAETDLAAVWLPAVRARELAAVATLADPAWMRPSATLPPARVGAVLYQAGYEVAHVLDATGADTGVMEVRQGADVWLVAPAGAAVMQGLDAGSLAADPDVARAFGLAPGTPGPLALGVRVSPLAGCPRNELLAGILRAVAAECVPRIDGPSLRLARFRLCRQQSRPGPVAAPELHLLFADGP